MSWFKVATTTDIPEGQMVQVEIEGEPIALYHTADGFYATVDTCTHAGETLTHGTLKNCVVECPKHGGKFDVKTGEAVAMPCVMAVETYPIEIRGTDVYVDFDE